MIPTTPQWPRRLGKTAGALVLITGVIVLLGWAFDVATLKSVLPGFPPMVPNTALGFVLSGLSLWLLSAEPLATSRKRAAQIGGVIIAVMGALTVVEYLFGWRLGMDQLLFSSRTAAVATPVAGRPSLLTAFNFFWFGLALVASGRKPRSSPWFADLLIVVPVLVALLALIGYACNVPSFYGWRSLFPNSAMGLHTTMTFVVLGAGLLCTRPDRGLMKVLIGKTAGSVIARRLLLAPVLIPLITGLLRMGGPARRAVQRRIRELVLRLSEYLRLHNGRLKTSLRRSRG
jgi:hypothetical protein